jgi:Na+/proline symporter
MDKIYLSIETSLLITTIIGIFFISLGYINTKKISNKRNYIVGDRNEGVFSLTTSLI